MARRELEFDFIAKTDRFRVDEPARDLDKLADAARDAGDDLGKLEDVDLGKIEQESGRAGQSLESLGKDAKSAAGQVDDSLDKMATSARSSLRKVDDHVERAR